MFLVEEKELKEIPFCKEYSSDKIRKKIGEDIIVFVTNKEEIYTFGFIEGCRIMSYVSGDKTIRFKLVEDTNELIVDGAKKPNEDYVYSKIKFFKDRFNSIIMTIFNKPKGTVIKITQKVMSKMLDYIENQSNQKKLVTLPMLEIIEEFKKRRLILDMFGNGYLKYDFNHKDYFLLVYDDGTQNDDTVLKHFGEEELCSISSANLKEEEFSFLLEEMEIGRQTAYYVIYDLLIREKIRAKDIVNYLLEN